MILPCSLWEAPSLQYIRNSLSLLALQRNPIQAILDDYFNGCRQLEVFRCEYCKLSSVPNVHPLNKSLRMLQLQDNRISSISHLYDISFTALENIILSHNNISHIEEDRLILPALESLELDHNALVTLGDVSRCGWGSTKTGPLGVTMHLYENPWHCNRSLSWLAAALFGVHQGNITLKFWFGDVLRCASPANLWGRSIAVLGKAYIQYSLSNTHTRSCTCVFSSLGSETNLLSAMIECNLSRPGDADVRQQTKLRLDWIMACCLFRLASH